MRALLLALLLLPALAQAQEASVRQLLEWNGALALLEQAQPVAGLALRAEAERRGASPAQQARWQLRIGDRFAPGPLQQRLIDHVAARADAAMLAACAELLQRPLAKRVRFFEGAMGRADSLDGLRRALAEGAADPERQGLVRELDELLGESRRVALLQTLVARRVQSLVGAPAPVEPAAEVALRREHLAPLTEAWLLHAYRYLRTEELAEYLALWREPALQWLQQISAEGMEAALAP